MCIVIAVFLVTTVFSIVEMYIKMQTTNMIEGHGYWHISIQGISEDAAGQIGEMSDVYTIAWSDVINEDVTEDYHVGSSKAALYGVDKSWIENIWDCLDEGTYPQNDNEVILSTNAKSILGVNIGDTISVDTPAGSINYIVSGFGEHDLSFNKLYDAITVYMDKTSFSNVCALNDREVLSTYYVRFASNRGTSGKISKIKKNFGVTDEALDENTALLALTGYSSNIYAKSLYPLAVILFALILMAGIFMISSSMNSNVAERTHFFGMMRCIGMSKKQIIQFVRLEALNWCKTAIPIGILLGVIATWGLCFWLRNVIQGEFTELPMFNISAIGIILGATEGILTVFLAAQSPAKRAAKVSPIAAVSGNIQDTKKQYSTTKLGAIKVEIWLGISHALSAKKNLILMTGSFALSIILFLGFSAGLDFAKSLIPSTRSWQPDFTITSDDELCSVDKNLADELEKINGVEYVYGNMAAMDVPSVSEKDISGVTLVSYDEYMFQCAKDCIVNGDFSKITEGSNYVLTIYSTRNPLEIGDIIQVSGIELEIVGTVSEGVFEDDITLICTEDTFERLMGKSDYAMLNMKVSDSVDKDEVVQSIRSLMSDDYSLSDNYNINKETATEYWAFRIVVYIFLAIIVLIAALNIINSTSMSVAARTKQYGAMRAVGMDVRQLTKMIVAEVFTYAVFGCVIGSVFGLILNKMIFEAFITAYFGQKWNVPIVELMVVLMAIFLSAIVAVYGPAKRMRNMAIIDTINEL
jgi:putative ABC transport system permease protein